MHMIDYGHHSHLSLVTDDWRERLYAGRADDVYVHRQSDGYAVTSSNSGLGYISLQIIDNAGTTTADVFLDEHDNALDDLYGDHDAILAYCNQWVC